LLPGSVEHLEKARRFQFVYLVAGLPFLLFALWGWEYGAFWLYFPGALLCLAQFVCPTFWGWAAVVTPVIAGAGLYLLVLAADLVRVIRGQRAEVFLSVGDTLVFLSLEALLLVLCFGLIRVCPPRRRQQRQELGLGLDGKE
jgi:hypothetical protein